jgi:hypothetical protein
MPDDEIRELKLPEPQLEVGFTLLWTCLCSALQLLRKLGLAWVFQ